MTDFHDTACPCAYCDNDRADAAASRRAMVAASIWAGIGFFFGFMAHAALAAL